MIGNSSGITKFSVLMSVYNGERADFLESCLNSLTNQTLQPNEIVLIIDGPIKLELQLVIDYFRSKLPLNIIQNETNLGLSQSLAKGLLLCQNEIVARMDSDDVSTNDRFEVLINHLALFPQIDILGSWASKISDKGDVIGKLRVPIKHNEIAKLIWTCPLIHPTVVFKKSKVISSGNYKPEAGHRQDDYDLWFRCLINNCIFENLPKTLFYYRFASNSIRKNNIKVGWARMKVGLKYCRILKLGPFAYVGVVIPLMRSLMPYPLNLWFYTILNYFNPRNL
jgi:glycosyltransferase involved in cell wall biosynthesis